MNHSSIKDIFFYTKFERISNFAVYPIRRCKSFLRNKGYRIKIKYTLPAHLKTIDYICLHSRCFKYSWHRPEIVFEFLEKLKTGPGKIIWFDDSDSTGVTHFEVLPYVDLYLKKQLLKDKDLYTRPLYGDRIFTDFYHRNFKIRDHAPYHSKPLDMALAHKIHLSWHIGLGDMTGDILPMPVKFLRNSILPPVYPNKIVSVENERPIDVMFRGSRKYRRNTVSFHRERIGQILDNIKGLKKVLKGRVSRAQYVNEMMHTKIVVSPFGWGEVGVRDMEAWIYGAALMKPDMSHMETWPDIFVPYETYYPINWNFDNLKDGIDHLLYDHALRLKIARNGQRAYHEMISKSGLKVFCNHLISQLERA